MEFNKAEASEVEAVATGVQQREVVELDNLQLAFVGGGNIIVTCG